MAKVFFRLVMCVFAFLLQAFSGSEGGGQGGIPAGGGPSHLQGSHQGNSSNSHPDTLYSDVLWIRIHIERKSRIRICIKLKS
jgi:hypothetical protein